VSGAVLQDWLAESVAYAESLAHERALWAEPLPAGLDAMLATAPSLTGTADMRWLRDPYLAEVDESEDFAEVQS
jgi:hypothetical protein